MKRSEMIKLMLDTDKGYRMCIASTGNYLEDEKRRMDNILKTMEYAGMVPPINKDKSFKILENGEMTYNVHEWDEE